MKSTGLGFKNIERVMGYVMERGHPPRPDNELVGDLYDQVIGQWALEAGHPTAVVGGGTRIQYRGGRPARPRLRINLPCAPS